MNLGLPQPPYQLILAGGVVLFLALVGQLLIGYRKIHFKGRTHLRLHKGVAWFMFAAAAFHALGALVFLGIIR